MSDETDNIVRLVMEEAEEVAPLDASAAPPAPTPGAPPDAPPVEQNQAAPPVEQGPQAKGPGLPPGCPVVPLGIEDDLYWYLDALQQLRCVKARDHSRLNLLSLFGDRHMFLEAEWPRTNRSGKVDGWRPEKVAECLMSAAARRGVWDVFGRLRGPGAWLGESGELVLHCGDGITQSRPPAEIWDGPDPSYQPQFARPGMIGRYVYAKAAQKPRPTAERDTGGEASAAAEMLALLNTWNWHRGEVDSHLLLGWIGAALMGGALDWRPMIWVTGDRSTGKSTLHEKVIKWLFGDGASLAASNTSGAGIWQTLGHASLPVLVDELEAETDNRRADNVIGLARQAASGGIILRGSADHKGQEFKARSCFLFDSINIPPLLGQDISRMAILRLGPLENATPPLLDERHMGGLGRRLRRQLLDNWPRWPATLESYRQQLIKVGHTGRSADQFGTLLAAADMLLSDWLPDPDTLGVWGERLIYSGLAELADDAPEWERCLEHLCSYIVDAYKDGVRRGLAGVIAEAAGRLNQSDGLIPQPEHANTVLQTYGLKVVQDDGPCLAVAANHQGLARIFQGTHWGYKSGAVGVWLQSFDRIPGATRSRLRFNAKSLRCVCIPIDQVLGVHAADDQSE